MEIVVNLIKQPVLGYFKARFPLQKRLREELQGENHLAWVKHNFMAFFSYSWFSRSYYYLDYFQVALSIKKHTCAAAKLNHLFIIPDHKKV